MTSTEVFPHILKGGVNNKKDIFDWLLSIHSVYDNKKIKNKPDYERVLLINNTISKVKNMCSYIQNQKVPLKFLIDRKNKLFSKNTSTFLQKSKLMNIPVDEILVSDLKIINDNQKPWHIIYDTAFHLK